MQNRVNIYFTEGTHKRLKDYIAWKHGRHRITSAIVQQAVNEFLNREGFEKKKG